MTFHFSKRLACQLSYVKIEWLTSKVIFDISTSSNKKRNKLLFVKINGLFAIFRQTIKILHFFLLRNKILLFVDLLALLAFR